MGNSNEYNDGQEQTHQIKKHGEICHRVEKKNGGKEKIKVAEYGNKHYRDRKMDRMSQYTTQGERKKKSCRWKTKNKKEINIALQTKGLKNKCKKINKTKGKYRWNYNT